MVMGHSVGEYVAATVAGVFTLEDGLRLIAARARLMQALPAGGRMAAVFAEEARVVRAIDACGSTASIAAVNGAAHTVLSGGAAEVQAVLDRLAVDGATSKELTVSHAFHSSLMDPMLDEFERVVRGVPMSQPRIKLVSNLTGAIASGAELTDPAYWRAHVRQPVRFSAGIDTLAREGCEIFVEIGPRPHLTGMAARCLPDHDAAWLPSLRPGHDDCHTILGSVGQMYVRGVDLDWRELDRGAVGARIALPTYPFERHSCWIDGIEAGGPAPAEVEAGQVPSASRPARADRDQECVFETVWTSPRLTCATTSCSVIVLPAAALSRDRDRGGREHFGTATPAIEQVTIHQALVLPDAGSRIVQLRSIRWQTIAPRSGSSAEGNRRPSCLGAARERHAEAGARGGGSCGTRRRRDRAVPRADGCHAVLRGAARARPRVRRELHGVKALMRRDGKPSRSCRSTFRLAARSRIVASRAARRLHPGARRGRVRLVGRCVRYLHADCVGPVRTGRRQRRAAHQRVVSLDPIGASRQERTARIRVVDEEGRLVARLEACTSSA